ARVTTMRLPAIAQYKDVQYVILNRVEGDRTLVHDPRTSQPQVLEEQTFAEEFNGTLILCTTRARLQSAWRKFDFTWFLPAILKYRRHLSEVVVASFFLQLFALLTPLFFQVVTDKVLVHKGVTTLHVLALGMLALSGFEAVLGGLRTYLFSHTSNRIDVGLGTQLFAHILRLPLAYFQARRTGDTVARARELDTIRQFLTNSALTVVLDCFFTLVFFAVMLAYSLFLTLVMRGELTIGQLIAFNMLAGRVSGPVLRLVQLWQDFQQAGISVERLGDVLNAPAEPSAASGAGGRTTLPSIAGRVTFEGVHFR